MSRVVDGGDKDVLVVSELETVLARSIDFTHDAEVTSLGVKVSCAPLHSEESDVQELILIFSREHALILAAEFGLAIKNGLV